jgi:hypothetical protein
MDMAIIDRPTELSEHLLEAVKKGQQGALEAIRTFVDSIDQALPLHGEGPSKRQEVIDSALAMADRLVQTQFDFLSTVIRSAGNTLGASQQAQEPEAKAEPKAEPEPKPEPKPAHKPAAKAEKKSETEATK